MQKKRQLVAATTAKLASRLSLHFWTVFSHPLSFSFESEGVSKGKRTVVHHGHTEVQSADIQARCSQVRVNQVSHDVNGSKL